MRSEIEFELFVRRPVEESLSRLEQAAADFKVTPEEVDRAVFTWVMKRVNAAGTVPGWVLKELSKIEEG